MATTQKNRAIAATGHAYLQLLSALRCLFGRRYAFAGVIPDYLAALEHLRTASKMVHEAIAAIENKIAEAAATAPAIDQDSSSV